MESAAGCVLLHILWNPYFPIPLLPNNNYGTMENPFVIEVYESKDLFCDREEELRAMLRNDVFLSRWLERL